MFEEIRKIVVEEPCAFASLNFGSSPVGELDLDNENMLLYVYPRVTEKKDILATESSPSEFNRIARAVINLSGAVLDYDPCYLVPEGDSVALEDARVQNGIISCNEVRHVKGEIIPRPILFKLNGARPFKIGSGVPNSKVVVFLDKNHFLSRPQKPFDRSTPSVVLYEMLKTSNYNLLEKVRPIGTFYEADQGMALAGLSTPPITLPGGYQFLLVHQVTSYDPAKKQYLQFGLLLDKTDPTKILAYTHIPIFQRCLFPECCQAWINGAVYIDNIHLDRTGQMIAGFVTVDDRDTYFVVISVEEIMSLMIPWESRVLSNPLGS